MGTLAEAIEAAERRKLAALDAPESVGIDFATPTQARALLSGWDIDFEEFDEIRQRVGIFFARAAFAVPLPAASEAAWTDGLLVGLMLATHGTSDT